MMSMETIRHELQVRATEIEQLKRSLQVAADELVKRGAYQTSYSEVVYDKLIEEGL